MHYVGCFDSPVTVHGVPFFYKNGVFERLPDDLREKYPNLDKLGRRCAGARIRFMTNSTELYIKIMLETSVNDIGIPLWGSAGINVFADDEYIGHAYPNALGACVIEKTFKLDGTYHDITVFLPRNEVLLDISVGVDDGADIREASPYTYPVPVMFYGSSITEGGCATSASNAYTAILSRWLDFDFYNMGFSGNALGQLDICDYLNSIEKSVFVMDYDYNAPTPEHLEQTHEPFFKRIREYSPDIPVIIISRPNPERDPADAQKRLEIIRRTYLNAVANGDTNVYFIDGAALFGTEDRSLCTADGVHPNDLGMYRMATAIRPVLKQALEKTI